jgi:2-oxoglutarate dehydrogenase E1 component
MQQRLVDEGVLTRSRREQHGESRLRNLSRPSSSRARISRPKKADWLDGEWSGLGLPNDDERRGKTGVAKKRLKELGQTSPVPGRCRHPPSTLARVLDAVPRRFRRGEGSTGRRPSISPLRRWLDEGFPVRLSGQDCGRGTFSQRHSPHCRSDDRRKYTPLNNIREGQAQL